MSKSDIIMRSSYARSTYESIEGRYKELGIDNPKTVYGSGPGVTLLVSDMSNQIRDRMNDLWMAVNGKPRDDGGVKGYTRLISDRAHRTFVDDFNFLSLMYRHLTNPKNALKVTKSTSKDLLGERVSEGYIPLNILKPSYNEDKDKYTFSTYNFSVFGRGVISKLVAGKMLERGTGGMVTHDGLVLKDIVKVSDAAKEGDSYSSKFTNIFRSKEILYALYYTSTSGKQYSLPIIVNDETTATKISSSLTRLIDGTVDYTVLDINKNADMYINYIRSVLGHRIQLETNKEYSDSINAVTNNPLQNVSAEDVYYTMRYFTDSSIFVSPSDVSNNGRKGGAPESASSREPDVKLPLSIDNLENTIFNLVKLKEGSFLESDKIRYVNNSTMLNTKGIITGLNIYTEGGNIRSSSNPVNPNAKSKKIDINDFTEVRLGKIRPNIYVKSSSEMDVILALLGSENLKKDRTKLNLREEEVVKPKTRSKKKKTKVQSESESESASESASEEVTTKQKSQASKISSFGF